MVSFERYASSPVENVQFPLFGRIKEPQKDLFLSSPKESWQILPQKVDRQKLLFLYGKDNINCSLGCNQMEDQPHLLSCPVINSQQETNDYSDLFGTNPEKTELITNKLMIKFNEFKTTVHRQSQPNAASTDNIDDNNVNIDVIHVVELD